MQVFTECRFSAGFLYLRHCSVLCFKAVFRRAVYSRSSTYQRSNNDCYRFSRGVPWILKSRLTALNRRVNVGDLLYLALSVDAGKSNATEITLAASAYNRESRRAPLRLVLLLLELPMIRQTEHHRLRPSLRSIQVQPSCKPRQRGEHLILCWSVKSLRQLRRLKLRFLQRNLALHIKMYRTVEIS